MQHVTNNVRMLEQQLTQHMCINTAITTQLAMQFQQYTSRTNVPPININMTPSYPPGSMGFSPTFNHNMPPNYGMSYHHIPSNYGMQYHNMPQNYGSQYYHKIPPNYGTQKNIPPNYGMQYHQNMHQIMESNRHNILSQFHHQYTPPNVSCGHVGFQNHLNQRPQMPPKVINPISH